MTIVGLGTIGMEVAKRAHAFGMRVTGVRRRLDQPSPAFCDRVFSPDQLDDALRGCDVLVLSAPAIPETDRLIDAKRLSLLNQGAFVVNVARGRIIDESELTLALQEKRLGGAVLDVFNREPLPATSPLWTLPNVIVTPHCSGIRGDHWDDAINLFIENLRRFLQGQPLLNLVDPRLGY
jgi:phosphoglycerate dehydrogenase-like enzyme